jgi:hypothetical protein
MSKWFGTTIVAMVVVLLILGTVLQCSEVGIWGSHVAIGHQAEVARTGVQQDHVMSTAVPVTTVTAVSDQRKDSGSTLCITANVGVWNGFTHLSIMSQFRSGSGSVAPSTAYMGGTQPAIGTASSPESNAWIVWPQTPRAHGGSNLPYYRVVVRSRRLQPDGTLL